MSFDGLVEISSVSDLISVFSEKEEALILNGIKCLLKSKPNEGPLSNYCKSQPTVPHFLKLFDIGLKSNNYETSSHILWLYCRVFDIFSTAGEEQKLSVAKVNLAKCLIEDHLKIFYRCFLSSNLQCQLAAVDLLQRLLVNQYTAILFITTFDFSVKNMHQISNIRTLTESSLQGKKVIPRVSYVEWILKLVEKADYESKVILSRYPEIITVILQDISFDNVDLTQRVTNCLLNNIIFNEENNKNLAVSFFKGGVILPALAKLCLNSGAKAEVVRKFLLKAFSTDANDGLCYPAEPFTILRNRLLADVMSALGEHAILKEETTKNFALKLMAHCPDVCWWLLNNGKYSINLDDPVSFAFIVALFVKLLGLLPNSTMKDTFIPRCCTRAILSKGLIHENVMIKLNILVLLAAIMRRIPDIQSKTDLKDFLIGSLPDSKTIVNSLKAFRKKQAADNNQDDEYDDILERCYLEVINEYLRIGVWEDLVNNISLEDLWLVGKSPEDNSDTFILIVGRLNQINLLKSNSFVNLISDAMSKVQDSSYPSSLIETWLYSLDCSKDLRTCNYIGRKRELWSKTIEGIFNIRTTPIIYPVNSDPICEYLGLTVPADYAYVGPAVEDITSLGLVSSSNDLIPKHNNKRRKKEVDEFNLNAIIPLIDGNDVISFLNSVVANTSKIEVLKSFASIPISCPEIIDCPYENVNSLLSSLLHGYNYISWILVLSKAFHSAEQSASSPDESIKIDLRALIENDILGYAIIGLSLNNLQLRKTSHLILSNFVKLLDTSKLKEKKQVKFLLDALAAQVNSSNVFSSLDRFLCFFYAESLPIILRPDNPMYLPILRLHLSLPSPSFKDVYLRFLLDTNEGCQKELFWMLGMIERAVAGGIDKNDENYQRLYLADHMAQILLLPSGLGNASRSLAQRILQACAPQWQHSLIL